MGKITGFRAVLGAMYWLIIISMSGIWAIFGLGIALFTIREGGVGFFGGALLGGLIGWLVAAYLTGIGHALLSINDHLEALRKGLDEPLNAAKEIR